jgi:photosystem II stability/assembly factor-like uncharacterized protein
MKRALLLGLLFLIGYDMTYSQSWRRVGNWGNQFTDIKWVSEEVGYIAGENILLKTLDGGLSWVEQEAPTDHLMLALDFYDSENGMVVGREGTVYQTSDGGANWQTIDLGTSVNLKDISYVTRDKVFISGDNGTLFGSTDGGERWSRQNLNNNAAFNSLYFVNADSGYITTSASEVIKTVDGGVNWQTLQTDFGSPLNDIYFLNDTVGYAVGDRGTIIKTQDAGLSWGYINSGMDTDFNRVVFNGSNPLLGLVAGKNGTLLRTANGGLTFATVGSRTTQAINGISFRPNSNIVYAVAGSGVVISSTNSGGSWTLRYSGRANDYTGVQFTTDLRGYIIGEEGLILLTGNGGTSFTVRSRPLSLPFNALHFVSNTAGYISGNNGNIITTTNSGGAWTALNPGTNRDVYGMYFFSINHGYVVGSRGYIAKTENRGVNWSTISPGNGDIDYRDIAFFDNLTGIIVGDKGWISRSEDGQNWSKINVPTNKNLTALEILDEQSAIAVGDKGTIVKTSDQGHTWKKVAVDYSRKFNDIEFLDESVGFIVGEKGLILKTSDAGETFERMSTGTFQNLTGVSFGDLSTGYAVGENGALFNYSCMVPETLTTVFGEDNICLSDQVYTVQESAEPGIFYEWRVDGGTVIEGQGTTRAVIRWDNPGRNAIMVRGQNNCGNGIPAALEVLVSIEPEQVTTITGNGAVCQDGFEEYVVDSLPGTEYIWETRGGVVRSGQGTPKVTIEWTQLGQQTLKVTPANACGQGPATEKVLNVSTAPSKPSSIQGADMVGLEEADYSVNEIPNVNYQWSTGGAGKIISGQGTHSARVLWEKEGDFVLSVTPMNACNEGESQHLEVNVNLITGIDEEEKGVLFNIYPNPSSGDIRIFTRGIPYISEIIIYNTLGQAVYQHLPKSGRYEFQVSNLPTGVHTVMVRSRTRNYAKMVVIQ